MAEWYSSLDNRSRKLVASLVAEAIDTAIFGFLCVVDGVRAAENIPAKGRFELLHIGERVTLLNAPEGIMLHDLYSAQ